MKRFNFIYLILILLGVLGGFLYYYFIGCSSGSCPLKSNPWLMMMYGGLIGYILADAAIWLINYRQRPKH